MFSRLLSRPVIHRSLRQTVVPKRTVLALPPTQTFASSSSKGNLLSSISSKKQQDKEPRYFYDREHSSFSIWLQALGIATAVTLLDSIAEGNVFSAEEKVPIHGIPGTSKERTFIAIKPDGVQRQIVGEIIKRFEQKGYKLVALKLVHPSEDFAKEHYSDLSTKPFFPGLVKYFSSGPVVAMVWEGRNVIKGGRKLVGATNPDQSEPGSIRGDLAVDVGRNIIHGSDSVESAKAEINLWFPPEQVSNYQLSTHSWVYEK